MSGSSENEHVIAMRPPGPEADLREGARVQEPGPAGSRSSTGDLVLTAVVLAARRAVESSIGSVIRTPPAMGRRPRTAGRRPAWVNDACD